MMRRRTFLLGSAAVAGGFAIGGYRLLRPFPPNPLTATLQPGQVALTPYVIVDETGVTVVTPRAEMGQGIHSTLAALVAEELDVPLSDVKAEHGPPSEVYANRVAHPGIESWQRRLLRRAEQRLGLYVQRRWKPQLTGGQTSIQDAYVKMRQAGAATRAVLVSAAARELGVPESELRTANGAVIAPDGTALPYTRLAASAADIEPPQDPPLKPRDQWSQLGRSLPRVDSVAKCTGTAVYSIDVRLPGMLHAVVRRNPHLGGRLIRFDVSEASNVSGFREVIPLDDGIIVVATNTWYAMEAADLVDVEWGPAPYPATSTAHREELEKAIDEQPGSRWRDDGDVDAALEGTEVVEGTYHVPYLAHATLEPMNAVAWLRDGQLDIWAGNQNPMNTRLVGARILHLPLDSVRVHTTFLGGGFGRRLEMDYVRTAVEAARAMPGVPVQVTWSREEDVTHDAYRPLATARFRGAVANGRPVALDLRVASPSLTSSARRRGDGEDEPERDRLDKFSVAGVADQPYDIENYRVTAHPPRRLLPVGWWRSVGESQNTFFHESAVDELAHAAGADPLEMRLSLLDHAPSRAVLEAVAEMSDWGSELPPGRARGVAYAHSSGAATAQVVEIRLGEDGIRLEKVFAAVDVGVALDPRNIEAQVQSAVIFGLCAAVHGEISVSDGRVEQSNFHDYPLLRIGQVREIQVHIHESGDGIYGVGEAGTPTAAPALGNAIFAATGRRLRNLPFERSIGFV